MFKEFTRQTISSLFILTIGLAMFTLTNNNYKQPFLFSIVYVVALIIQLIFLPRFSINKQNKNSKRLVIYSFIFLTLGVFFSLRIGVYALNSIEDAWIFILGIVGIHFLFYIPANNYINWQPQILLIFLTVLNCIIGFFFYKNNMNILFIIDGLIKIIYGIIMVKLTTKAT